MKARINQREVTYRIEGETDAPDHRVLLAHSPDLSAGTAWAAAGYVVASGLAAPWQQQLLVGLEELVRQALRTTGLPVAPNAPMHDYHHLIGSDQARHLAVVEQLKEMELARLPIASELLEEWVGSQCGRPVRAYNPATGKAVFHLRVVRPGLTDNNPLHRDAWLPIYDGCINIYGPVCGSTPDSSLSLVPGSHWWPESRTVRTRQGAVYNGVVFTVPGVKTATGPLELIRPNPGPDQLLLFSPYLLHGGAVNDNPDQTRISLEMRFWLREPAT